MLVTRIVLQLRQYAERNQTVLLGASDLSAESEAAIAGFAVTNYRGPGLGGIRFAVSPRVSNGSRTSYRSVEVWEEGRRDGNSNNGGSCQSAEPVLVLGEHKTCYQAEG